MKRPNALLLRAEGLDVFYFEQNEQINTFRNK